MPLDGSSASTQIWKLAPEEMQKRLADLAKEPHSNVVEMFKGAGLALKKGVSLEQVISALRVAANTPLNGAYWADRVAKGFTQPASATSGLAQYDLEQGAKLLYPVTTIFRNMIPRVTGGTGIQTNYRKVTAINPGGISANLQEGQRGGAMGQTVVDAVSPFRTLGLDNFVTEQAYLAAVTFEDLYSLTQTMTLQGLMEQEEQNDIGGNSSIALGTPATPTGAAAATGGHLSDGTTYSVIVVALTYMGMRNSTPPTVNPSTGALSGGAVALPYTRTNLDGTTTPIQGFSGIQSAASSAVTLSAGTAVQAITASVTAINGAIGYAWYLGATAGTERLVAITGYSKNVTLTNTNSTGQLASVLPASDTSQNSLAYDGILTQILTSGSGAYVADLGGAALTSAASGSGGITEFNTLIADRIANFRLVPTDIFMSPTDQQALSKLILTGNTNLAPFFMGDSSENGMAAAAQARVYNNPVGFSTERLEIHAHPFVPAGTIIFYSRSNPYPLSNVPALLRTLCRRDYWSVEWPVVTMQRTTGVYCDKTLQMYFPPAFGVITGVKS